MWKILTFKKKFFGNNFTKFFIYIYGFATFYIESKKKRHFYITFFGKKKSPEIIITQRNAGDTEIFIKLNDSTGMC